MTQFNVRSLAMVAGALSRQYGVTVQSGGASAYTTHDKDGKLVINIPSVEIDNPNYMTLLRGFLDHESGHALASDWVEWKKIEQLGSFYATVGNIFEDYVVERRMGDAYPGCRYNLQKLGDLLFDEQYEEADPVQPDDVHGILGRVARYLLYGTERCPGMARRRNERRAELEEVMPGLADALDAQILPQVDGLLGTADTLRLTQETKDLLAQWIKDNPQSDPDQQQQLQQSVGDGQQGQDDGQQQGQGDGQQQGQGDGQQMQRQGPSRGEEDYGTDVSRKAEDAIGARDAEWAQTLQKFRHTVRDSGKGTGAGGMGTRSHSLTSLPNDMASEALKASAALDARLSALLQHKALNREGGRRQGRLDTRKLYRLAINDPRIFCKNTERVQTNTEVTILADMSGSMDDRDKNTVQSKAVFALMSSLRKLKGVKSSVYAFLGSTLLTLRRAHEPLTTDGMYMRYPDGGTPAGAALHRVLQKVSPDHNVRRIVVVMTDGSIDDHELWQVNLELAQRNGIEVVGIGICSSAIAAILPAGRSSVVTDLSKLSEAMFNILGDLLLQAA